ncbi:UDP-2,3-diacylglucosamine diphosphatase [Acinetobacter sp. MD2(2019)]|uniref:UDP-2,3-diacylglucosamine diphosphatase n=1 Tax=Acinetobacter sp. MD2(2019) TaxID=2605273 RepID=UPI002D1E5EA9|nr:UDP-2,3-diacylglucosamine diphosphatase [Acinetobacter sp. MD2(2019)]MEB3754198.1 UDP-2,3-diacylglucosamine diphosphatase [Acinetobacter sp. MD2(2019)]
MTTYLFIADLHLSPEHPRLVRGFFALLEQYQHRNTQLYILGDWFNAWIGDDLKSPFLDEIVRALQHFNACGNQIYFQVGNRDFALGQAFLDQFSGILLPDTYFLDIAGQHYRLEHGDALCTDDVAYQRFKKVIRNPVLLGLLKKTPLAFRQKLANGFRKKSHAEKQNKNYAIMDVNADAVAQAMPDHIQTLIHGHTHRPKIHKISATQQRIVLGDWRENPAEAMILEISAQGDLRFFAWQF